MSRVYEWSLTKEEPEKNLANSQKDSKKCYMSWQSMQKMSKRLETVVQPLIEDKSLLKLLSLGWVMDVRVKLSSRWLDNL